MNSAGYDWRKDPHKSIVPPIYRGVAFGFTDLKTAAKTFSGELDCFAYSRLGNPPISDFCGWLAGLEGGVKAFATNSGMSATNLLLMALTGKKKKIVTSPFIYGGTYHLFQLLIDNHNWPINFVRDAHNPDAWQKTVDKDTAFIFLETPSNPRLEVFDIAAIADIAHRKGTWLIVDNTIATPALQRPFELGADAVLHSVTKYLIRQSVGLGGAIVCNAKFADAFGDKLFDWFAHLGAVMDPDSAFAALNNSPILRRDMLEFSRNALKIALFLGSHPKIKKVYHPHYPSNPNYELAKKQMPDGGSGLLAFETWDFESAKGLIEAPLRRIIIAPHLGDIRDLIIHPASTTHSKLTKRQLAEVHITPELIRLSAGISDLDGALSDLEQALNKI